MKPAQGVGIVLAALLAAAAAGCHGDTLVAPRLEAGCGATPASGPAPLRVAFDLSVSGADGPFSVAVSYGDGTTGSEPDRAHTFAAAGVYPVAFTVTTQSQSARCSVTVAVSTPAIVPVPIVNTPPEAEFQTTPPAQAGRIAGAAPLSIRFNMCGSSDVDHDVLRYTMDFQGDGTKEVDGITGGACRRDFAYPAGTFRPRICVVDQRPDGQPLHDFHCQAFTVSVTP